MNDEYAYRCVSDDGTPIPCMEVTCPACGKPCVVQVEEWERVIHYASMRCDHCETWMPMDQWHRSYERQEFARLGVVTPRMTREQGATT
jgi:hypothetical protein